MMNVSDTVLGVDRAGWGPCPTAGSLVFAVLKFGGVADYISTTNINRCKK